MSITLTPRRLEILRGVLDGLQNKEIGKRLNIKERTVKAHLTRLYLYYDIDPTRFVSKVRLAFLAHRSNPELCHYCNPKVDEDNCSSSSTEAADTELPEEVYPWRDKGTD